jgi:hypothetical protein
MLTMCLVAAISAAVGAEPLLQPVGVIGNPGESGPSLIRQGWSDGEHPAGCGVVLDPRGTLWTRMAGDRVSRLARDGRVLAQFPAPPSNDRYDTLTLVGGLLVLRAGDALATLPLEAAPGTAFQRLGVTLRLLARTPCQGRLAAVTKEGTLVWFDPVDGKLETVADTPDAWLVESTPDGVILVGTTTSQGGRLQRFVAGREVTAGGWPRPLSGKHVMAPGARAAPPFLQGDGEGGFFQGGQGFLAHSNAQFEPAPGTVLGAQSDNVIGGGGDWREELEVARGIARCGDGVYAVCGVDGGIFYATWPDRLGPMRLAARLTSLPGCNTLAVNADGTVFAGGQAFAWASRPDGFPSAVDKAYFMRSPIVHVGPKLLARIDNWGHMTSFAVFLFRGERLEERKTLLWFDTSPVEAVPAQWRKRADGETIQPAVAVADGQGWRLLCLATPADAMVLRLDANGRADQPLGPVPFTWAAPVKALTGLARRNDTTLLAVVDGQIATLAKDGDAWRETPPRWGSWGGDPAEKFGPEIHLACDGERLIVADSARHRVLLFAPEGGRPLAQVGTTDQPGAGLAEMDRPTLVDILGERAVVYDAGNQRIVKLRVGGAGP